MIAPIATKPPAIEIKGSKLRCCRLGMVFVLLRYGFEYLWHQRKSRFFSPSGTKKAVVFNQIFGGFNFGPHTTQHHFRCSLQSAYRSHTYQ